MVNWENFYGRSWEREERVHRIKNRGSVRVYSGYTAKLPVIGQQTYPLGGQRQ